MPFVRPFTSKWVRLTRCSSMMPTIVAQSRYSRIMFRMLVRTISGWSTTHLPPVTHESRIATSGSKTIARTAASGLPSKTLCVPVRHPVGDVTYSRNVQALGTWRCIAWKGHRSAAR